MFGFSFLVLLIFRVQTGAAEDGATRGDIIADSTPQKCTATYTHLHALGGEKFISLFSFSDGQDPLPGDI